MVNSLISAAQEYLEKGWRVIPTVKKSPCVEYKVLKLDTLYHTSPNFKETFLKLFEDHPEAEGIALIINESTCVLDLDSKKAEAEFHDITEDAVGIKTARGSKYIFTQHPYYNAIDTKVSLSSLANFSAKFHIRQDAEIILEGMLCELPPGLHKNGAFRYEWIKKAEGQDFTALPRELANEVSKYGEAHKEGKGFAKGELEELLQGVSEGEGRNEAAIRIAGHLIGKGNTWGIIEATLEGWNRKNKPPIARKELEGILKSAKKMHDEKPEDRNQRSSDDLIEEISLEELKSIKLDLNNRRMPNLHKILPEDHFINVVDSWMSGLSDTYYEYRVSSALWLLSALTQGKGCVAMKQGTIHPNLYILLLGQSTKSRKSTAIKKIKPIFEAATDGSLYNDDPTIEGYLEMLAKNPVQNFIRDEVAGLMAKYHKKYNDGIFDLECNVYDGDSVRKIKAAGRDKEPKEYIIKDPYVTHLYATTPDKYSSVMSMEDFMCGYGYRLLYSFPTYAKARMDNDIEDNEDAKAWAEVSYRTKLLYKRYQEAAKFKFTMTKGAIKLYNDIGINLEDAGEALHNEQLDSAIGRAQDNILKLAMLIEVGKDTPSHEITEESISIASLMMLDFYLPSFMQIMDRILSDVKTNKIEKAISVIRRMGGNCTRSSLIQNGHFTKKECDEVVEAMVIGNILLEKKIKETKTLTYILTTESKTLEMHSTELTDMFSTLRRVSKVSSLASNTIYSANSAKSNIKITTDTTDNDYTCGSVFNVPCVTANSAKFANSAKSTPIYVKSAEAALEEGF